MAKNKAETATVQQVLLWMDQPEILFLKKTELEYIVAVSSVHDAVNDADGYQFVGASMTLKQVEAYQEGKSDLRFAMTHANLRRFWVFTYYTNNPEVVLRKYSKTSPYITESLPESGFFSRSHDRIKVAGDFVSDADERFDIDGSWDLGEFSKFYGQVEDIYYILNDVRRFTDPNASAADKVTISEAFNRPWRGGGSYLGYYDNIANDNRPTARLRVGGIQYNSPGFVKIKAKKQPFDAMITLLQGFAEDPSAAKKSYNILYRYLSSLGLLKAAADVEITPLTREALSGYAVQLSDKLDGVSFETIKEMAHDNVLVAAKVLLSLFRRTEHLYRFFEQGRVKYEGLDTDPLKDDEA